MTPSTLAEALQQTWEIWPDRTALVCGARRVSYAEFGAAVAALASAYGSLGVRPGDRVLCSVSNRPEYLVSLGAAWAAGAVHVGVDHQLTGPELSSAVALTGARALVYEPAAGSADPLLPPRAVRERHPEVRIAVVGDGPRPAGYRVFADLARPDPGVEGRAAPSGARPSPADPAVIFITSGTTGTPKATLGFHGNLCQRWRRLGGWLGFGPDDVHFAQLPLAHGFGLMMAVAAFLTGGRLVLVPRFSADEALCLIGNEGVTVLNGAPAHFKLLLSRLDPARHRVRSLRLSVGTAAAFPLPLVRAIWQDLGVDFMFMYGSSEGVGVATTDREDILRGSVGRPAPGSVAVVGPDRKPLPAGEVGEIAFSRAAFPVRYWRESGPGPAAPAGDGEAWYYSGDVGRLDADGRLYVLGRLKHQIDRGGLKVDPVEVENALLRHHCVADAAVVGRPNPVLGETVCAYVVAAPGQAPSLEEIRSALGGELAPYKLPEELCILDQIPRTAIGKVDLGKLQAIVAAGPGRP
jgi:acyl-CoA synthetase (AMP-forming)/AMP-acid ligase II